MFSLGDGEGRVNSLYLIGDMYWYGQANLLIAFENIL